MTKIPVLIAIILCIFYIIYSYEKVDYADDHVKWTEPKTKAELIRRHGKLNYD